MQGSAPGALDGRVLHLSLDVTVRPPADAEPGETDAAMEMGRRLSIEAGLLAQRLAPHGSTVEVVRQIIVY